jgi:hypothetical protein
MPASQGRSIHCNNPLYNRLAGGIHDVVGLGGGHKRRLVLVTKGELDSVTEGFVCRLAGRLNLTRSLVGRLVAGGLVGRELVVARLVIRGLVVAGGLVIAGSFQLLLLIKELKLCVNLRASIIPGEHSCILKSL